MKRMKLNKVKAIPFKIFIYVRDYNAISFVWQLAN